MFIDYLLVLKEEAKETQDKDYEVADNTNQQVAYLLRITFSSTSIGFYLTLCFCLHHSSEAQLPLAVHQAVVNLAALCKQGLCEKSGILSMAAAWE